jgi:lipopolysaccharide/colanic/teichoic acid biosynthesis glycosyltransferase
VKEIVLLLLLFNGAPAHVGPRPPLMSGARHYVSEDMKIFNVYVYLSRMVCAVLSLYSLSWVIAVVRR